MGYAVCALYMQDDAECERCDVALGPSRHRCYEHAYDHCSASGCAVYQSVPSRDDCECCGGGGGGGGSSTAIGCHEGAETDPCCASSYTACCSANDRVGAEASCPCFSTRFSSFAWRHCSSCRSHSRSVESPSGDGHVNCPTGDCAHPCSRAGSSTGTSPRAGAAAGSGGAREGAVDSSDPAGDAEAVGLHSRHAGVDPSASTC